MTQEQRIEHFMLEIARLSNQVVDLQNERDALAAQVEALKSAYQNLCGVINDMDDCEAGTDEMETAIDAVFYAMRNGYNSVHADPQYHLAEIRAEAVKNEFDSILHSVANQFTANDTTNPWHNGANHVFVLFAKEIDKRVKSIRQGEV